MIRFVVMNSYRTVLTIAGSDSGGGAGLQADIKTISACGCYAAAVVTAITCQNTMGVRGFEVVSGELLRGQICAVLDDIRIDAVKIGMVGNAENIRVVAQLLRDYSVQNVVLDPVLVATSGDSLGAEGVQAALMSELLPLVTVITPNLPEAQALTGFEPTPANYEAIARRFSPTAVLLKGGHAPIEGLVCDTLFTSDERHDYPAEYIETLNTHGTGCTLSSALASYLAHGFALVEATDRATKYIHHAIATGREYRLGHGHGPVHHFFKYWN